MKYTVCKWWVNKFQVCCKKPIREFDAASAVDAIRIAGPLASDEVICVPSGRNWDAIGPGGPDNGGGGPGGEFMRI